MDPTTGVVAIKNDIETYVVRDQIVRGTIIAIAGCLFILQCEMEASYGNQRVYSLMANMGIGLVMCLVILCGYWWRTRGRPTSSFRRLVSECKSDVTEASLPYLIDVYWICQSNRNSRGFQELDHELRQCLPDHIKRTQWAIDLLPTNTGMRLLRVLKQPFKNEEIALAILQSNFPIADDQTVSRIRALARLQPRSDAERRIKAAAENRLAK